MARERLPIDDVLSEVIAAVRVAGACVLRASTGAGKTTRVPPALMDHGRLILLEPRRVAARAAAMRMAAEDGSPLGDRFGYHVRFDRKAGPNTRVVAVTPGILLRQLHDDPFLEGTATVVFDEFHERGLESDLALGLVTLLRQTVRPDLRIVVMSATVDPGPIATYLGDCPVVVSEGRTFPVEIRYRPRRTDVPVPIAAVAAVRELLDTTDGDVLVFLPGLGEIRRTAAELGTQPDIEVLLLHGDLPPEQQDRALRKLPRRKVVLATNVAETSVTVEGVTAVVDTGLARQPEFDASVGLDRLRLVPIAKASADQRAGRAGRTAPGICVRLWDEMGHRARAEQTEPEISRADLAAAVMHLHVLGESDIHRFPWFEMPPRDAVERANTLLRTLGALDERGLTELGQVLAGLPVHPRIGRLLVEGDRLGVTERAALAAAILSERDPFLREGEGSQRPRAGPATVSDLLDRVEALEAFDANGRLDGPLGRLHLGGAQGILRVRDQLLRLAPARTAHGRSTVDIRNDELLLQAIFAAYPDRLARRRGSGDRRAKLVGGRGVKLGPQSGVAEAEFFVCIDVEAGGVESIVRQASAVRREWLQAEQIETITEVVFDAELEKLVARKQRRYGDLVLEETPAHIADEESAAMVLAAAAAERWEKVLPPAESEAGRFLLRLRCLRGWMPDLDLQAIQTDLLKELLPQLCRGRRSLAAIQSGPWLDVLRGALTYQQLQILDREAPDRLTVPSGSAIALTYEDGRPPILAARIQELFGLTETPRIAGGRVKVLLHLLAPNYRPQQVTDDLASFWATGYPQVRKDLRARYPRHAWPETPTAADAIRGPKKKRDD